MIAKVAISFLSDDTDAELIVDSGRILAAMTGNANYPTPNPTLAAVARRAQTSLPPSIIWTAVRPPPPRVMLRASNSLACCVICRFMCRAHVRAI